jgi:hypothetical protein
LLCGLADRFIRRLLELPMIGTNDDDWLFLSLVRHQRIIKLIAEIGVSITQEASLIRPTNLLQPLARITRHRLHLAHVRVIISILQLAP